MTKKQLLTAAVFAVLLCAFVCTLTEDAAAADTSNYDKDRASRHGIGESLASADEGDGEEGVTLFQACLGFGSVAVMIAVVKWL